MRAALVLCASSPRNIYGQHITLWSAAARSGLAIAGVFDGDSLDELRRLIAHREIDVVLAWDGNCLGHELLHAISATQCGLYSYSHEPGAQPPDVEPERNVETGIARTRAQGRRPGRPRVAPDIEAAIRAALATSDGIRATARRLGIGVSTVQRVRAEHLDQAGAA